MFHVFSFQKDFDRVLLSSVFLFFCFLFSFSHGSNISNFAQWTNLNSTSKTAYTAGVIDGFIRPLPFHNDHEDIINEFVVCLKELRISTFEIVNMIDNFYLNSENWGLSPQDAIRFQLVNGHCFQYFNE